MPKPVIFLGPTLKIEKAKAILDADFRPPAKKGDLVQLALRNVSIIGLIDGYFLQDYPPTPIEVYNLLRKKNVKVYGSSSLGALRAVELKKFGMIGIGKIYDLFEKEKINSDDEVAVTFTEYSGYKSEALIDIRYNLFLARRKGIIDSNTGKIILATAKKIYFPYRTYEDILNESVKKFPEIKEKVNIFMEYIVKSKKSLKEIDAIKLLHTINSIIKNGYQYFES